MLDKGRKLLDILIEIPCILYGLLWILFLYFMIFFQNLIIYSLRLVGGTVKIVRHTKDEAPFLYYCVVFDLILIFVLVLIVNLIR